jgi:hypothetical protein
LCDYCEKGRDLKKTIEKLATTEGVTVISIEEMTQLFKDKALNILKQLDRDNDALLKEILSFNYEKCKQAVSDLNDYDAILYHQFIATSQRSAYKSHLTAEFLKEKILIELDFKQKIVIGLSQRQVSSEYYNQVSRSCLGF